MCRIMTARSRAMLSPTSIGNTARRLEELKSFTFLACDEFEGRVVEYLGAQVSSDMLLQND